MKKIISRILTISLSCYVAFLALVHISAIPQINNDDDFKVKPFYFEAKGEDK